MGNNSTSENRGQIVLHPKREQEIERDENVVIEKFRSKSKSTINSTVFEADSFSTFFEVWENAFPFIITVKWEKNDSKFGSDVELRIHSFQRENKQHGDDFVKRLNVYAALRHAHIMPIHGILSSEYFGVVTGYGKYGDLRSFLEGHPAFPMSGKIRFLKEIASCIKYLHETGIVHRKLRLEHIHVNKDVGIWVDGFGLWRLVDEARTEDEKGSSVAEGPYIAPEAYGKSFKNFWHKRNDLEEKDYVEFQIDVYSFGIIAWMCLSGNLRKPYGSGVSNDQISKKVSEDPEFRPSMKTLSSALKKGGVFGKMNKDLTKMVEGCLSHDPRKRPNFGAIHFQLEQCCDQVKEVMKYIHAGTMKKDNDTTEDF